MSRGGVLISLSEVGPNFNILATFQNTEIGSIIFVFETGVAIQLWLASNLGQFSTLMFPKHTHTNLDNAHHTSRPSYDLVVWSICHAKLNEKHVFKNNHSPM